MGITVLALISVFFGSRLVYISLSSFELYPLRIFGVIGLFCVLFFRKRSFDPLIRYFVNYSAIFLFIAIASIFWTQDKTAAVREMGVLLTGIVLSLLIVRNINSLSRIRLLLNIWLLGSIFVNLLGLWEVINHEHIVKVAYYAAAADERMMNSVGFLVPRSIFSNQNNYGYFNSMTSLVLLGLLIKPYKPRVMYTINIIGFILSFGLLTYSYSRAGIGGFFIGVVIFLILGLRSNLKTRKYLIRYLVAVSFIFVFVGIYYTNVLFSIGNKINLVAEKETLVNNSGRINYYTTSIEYALDHLGIGMGPGSSIIALNGASPHNHLLQVLVEYGVFILVGLLWFLYYSFKRLKKYAIFMGNSFPLMICATIVVFPFQVLGPSSIIGEGIYWLWLGFIIALSSILYKERIKIKAKLKNN